MLLYIILVTYLVSPYQTWGVFPNDMPLSQLWLTVDKGTTMFDAFDYDWIKEDENDPAYQHELLGELSTNNVYINRFLLREDELFSAVEIGITNDFDSLSIYMNNILIYEEDHHVSNQKNYFRVLASGSILHKGSNVVIVLIDNMSHLNNVYVYGYAASLSQRTDLRRFVTNRLYVHSILCDFFSFSSGGKP